MKILIFGAGGIGSVLGVFLARMGHDVSLLGRAWHLDVVEKKGLVVTGIWGDYRSKAFDLYRSAEEVKKSGKTFDLIFLTVKSFDTEKAAEELVPLMGEKTTLVSIQNGLGNIETILKKVRPEQYLIGRAIFGVELEPGIAKVTVIADPLAIGPVPGSKPILTAIEVAHLLSNARLETKAVQDILPIIWSKVIYNCALNAICTLHEIPYGKILEKEETRAAMERVVRECYAVGQARQVALEPATADEYLRLLIDTLIPRTASHIPSMLQDIRKGKRTDIGSLNGAVSRYGHEMGIPTPENDRLAAAIR